MNTITILAGIAALTAVAAPAVVIPVPHDGDRFAWQHVEWQEPLDTPAAADSALTWGECQSHTHQRRLCHKI